MVFHKFLLFAFLAVLQFNAYAMEIFTWSGGDNQIDPQAPWTLKGEIEKGDLAKFKAAIVATGVLPKSVMLDSTGGDINEAIDIGLFLRHALIRYRSVENLDGNAANAECSSACALIFFSTVEKHIHVNSKTKIGLHQPYFDRDYRARLDSRQAELQYQRAERTLRSHLRELQVPDELADVMFSTAPTSTRYFSDLGLAQWQPAYPAYEAWKNANCEAQSPDRPNPPERTLCLADLESAKRQAVLQKLLLAKRQ